MDTLTSPSFLKNKYLRAVVFSMAMGWMAFYPIYKNYYDGLGMEQYERHLSFMAHQSMFFNPWQYRILCPLLVEGIYSVLDATVFNYFDFSRFSISPPENSGDKSIVTQKLVAQSGNAEFVKYNIVFVLFRFVQHLVIFVLAFRYFSHFIKNRSLLYLSLIVIALIMGNAVPDSDLSFNTYMDVILYLVLGIVVVEGRSVWWILILTIIGAFNRETSLLIPVLYTIAKLDFSLWPAIGKMIRKERMTLTVVALSFVCFVIIFISIRSFYGYQAPTVWRVPAGLPMIKLNLFSSVSIKTYNELFGVFGIMLIWCLVMIRRLNPYLQRFFITMVPLWFAIHLWAVVAYQSRLFLVPAILIFIPAILSFIAEDAEAEG